MIRAKLLEYCGFFFSGHGVSALFLSKHHISSKQLQSVKKIIAVVKVVSGEEIGLIVKIDN